MVAFVEGGGGDQGFGVPVVFQVGIGLAVGCDLDGRSGRVWRGRIGEHHAIRLGEVREARHRRIGGHTGAEPLSNFGAAGRANAGGVGVGVGMGKGWTAAADGALDMDDEVVE